jgi:uncharacterized protein YegL
MKKDLTKIVFILDKSGSMAFCKNDVIGGFNTFIEDQKQLEGEATLSLILFSDSDLTLFDNINIKDVEPLTEQTYVPSGMTALYDAIGKAIDETGILLHEMAEDERPERVLFVIMTDGEENSSLTYDKKIVQEKTQHQQEKYKWEFIYLGANQDAMTEAQSIGIHNYTNYTTGMNADGTDGTSLAYHTVSKSVSSFRTMGCVGDMPDSLIDSDEVLNAINNK